MAVVINTNVDSIKIQNCLTKATGNMTSIMQRMSTGLKVNSAKDDAAGCVIAAKMQVQLNGNKIAQTNVQNASALLSTAEGNLDVVEDNLVRIRDLTLQAKNGTYSKSEIKAMQDEVGQRIDEINRISTSSKYSSLQLFGATDGLAANGATFQVGANKDDDNTIKALSSLFASVKFDDLTKLNEAVAEEGEEGEPAAPTVTYEEVEDVPTATNSWYYTTTEPDEADLGDFSDQEFYISDGGGGHQRVWLKDTDTAGATGLEELGSTQLFTKNVSTPTPQEPEEEGETEEAEKTYSLDLETLGKTEKGFENAIKALDDAIDNITGRKSQIGSLGNRLDSALATLTTQYENLSSAKSVITDADIAAEASRYTQESILQQVSTSLLAQANQAPSIALSLV